MSERERGNNVITWSVVMVLFGIFLLISSPNSMASESMKQTGIVAIIGGFLFIIWGSVLRGSTTRSDSNRTPFGVQLIIGIVASIIAGILLHAILSG